ncbi:hypothetical protein Tco_0879265 [Tanacetum coccineum]
MEDHHIRENEMPLKMMVIGYNQRACSSKAEEGSATTVITPTRYARGGLTFAKGGKTSARGGLTSLQEVAEPLQEVAKPLQEVSSPSSPSVGFEMSPNHAVRTTGSGIRIRGDVYMGGSQPRNSPTMALTRPIGYGVSWDPVDGETMLGLRDSMGIPRPAWPEGIIPEDVMIHVESQAVIPLTASQPLASQKELKDEEPVRLKLKSFNRNQNQVQD